MGFFTSWFHKDELEELSSLRIRVDTLEEACTEYEEMLTDQGRHCANYAEAYFVLRNFVTKLKGKKATLALSDSQRSFVGVDEHKYVIHRADVLKNIVHFPTVEKTVAYYDKETTPSTKQDLGCTRIDCYADYPHESH